MALRQICVPYIHGYDFGIGVDLATGSPMNKVVDGVPSGVQHAVGANVSFDIISIRSTTDLESALQISVEASYGCGAFGAGVSARFDFAKRAKVQTSSIFFAITSTVKLQFLSIDEPVVTPAATELTNRHDVFDSRYGNMFVRGVDRGGLFVALMRIDTQNSEDSLAISAELEGSYGAFSAEAKMKFEEMSRKYRSEMNISVYHEGGPIDMVMQDLQDPLELYKMLVQFLKSFEENPDKNAVPYNVTLAPISIANGPIPPNVREIQHAQDILVMCAKQRSQLLDQYNLLEYMINNPGKYDFIAPVAIADLHKASKGFQADLDLIADCAAFAINEVKDAKAPALYAEKKQVIYPQGILPEPIPKLKPGIPTPAIASGRTSDLSGRLVNRRVRPNIIGR